MAIERNPNDPYDRDRLNDPISPDPYTQEMRTRPRIEKYLQADPELAKAPASNSRIAIFALGIAILLGAVFYGLNNTSIHQHDTSKIAPATAQNSTLASPPAGMRDVTPRANNAAGTTTGNAPASK